MNEQEQLKPNRPTHRAYVVKDQKNSDRGRWIEIGAAWVHKDGKGFSLSLDAVPTNSDRIECRMIDWKKIDETGRDADPAHEDTAY